MAIRSLLTKGIGSLLKRKKPKPNRRLTPEEIAERKAAEAYKMQDDLARINAMPGTQMRNATSAQVMRAMKVGDETMDMIRASVMKMDLPPAKIPSVLKSIEDQMRRLPPAQLAKADPTKLAKDILKIGLGATVGLGAGMGLEGAAREGRLPEMIQDSILVDPEFRGKRPGAAIGEMLKSTKMDGGDYTYPFEGIARGIAGEALFGPEQSLFERNSQISDDNPRYMFEETAPGIDPWDRMTMFGSGYDEPDPEPGLEEGSIADLLLFNRMFGD